MSKDKNRMLCRPKFFASEQNIYSSLTFWRGRKRRMPSRKLAVLSFGIIVTPHSMREMQDISLQSWNGWKKNCLDLLPQAVEELVLMTPLCFKE